MGVFFKSPDLSHITSELDKQKQWMARLHKYSTDIHKYAEEIKHSNIKHKREVVEHLSSLTRWIDELNEGHNNLRKDMNELRIDLKRSLRKDFEAYHRILMEFISLKIKEESLKKDLMKQEVFDELKKELQVFSAKRITNKDNENNVIPVMHYNAPPDLNNPEKELLNLMFNENKPMTYEMMAQKLNKSVNSVRVYMNSLRVKKDIIDEFKGPAGSKIFSVRNSEVVKTLFNAR